MVNKFGELVVKLYVAHAQRSRAGRAKSQQQGLIGKGNINKMSKNDECYGSWIC